MDAPEHTHAYHETCRQTYPQAYYSFWYELLFKRLLNDAFIFKRIGVRQSTYACMHSIHDGQRVGFQDVLITFCEPVIHIIVFVFCMKAKVSVLFSDNDILDIQHTGMWEPDLKCIVYIIDRYIIWTRVSCRPMQRALLRFSYAAQDVGRQFERPIKFRQNEVVLRLFDPNKHS